MVKHMKKAALLCTAVKGVKGPTPLMNLPNFNLVWGFTPDYMHCVLLGVTRQITELYLSKVGEKFYIGDPSHLNLLNERLCSMKPPAHFHRLQRSLSLRRFWKASEWQQWLLFFAMPCMDGVLDAKYLNHFALLVRGVSLLLQDTVSSEDVAASTDSLVKFVVDVQFLFGEAEMTYNVHQLLHLPKSVAQQGPLWAHSCFAFESNLGQIKELVTSAKGVPLQIVERLMMKSSFASLKALASAKVQTLLSKNNGLHQERFGPLGKPRAAPQPLLELVQNKIGHIVSGPVVEHDRVALSRYILHSEQYARPNKTDSTAAITPLGKCFKIAHLLSFKDIVGRVRVFAVSYKFLTSTAYRTAHIMKAERVYSRNLVEIEPGIVPCVYMEVGSQFFLYRFLSRLCFEFFVNFV
ncbi:uncharacterized protein LOC119459693 [Dermacentor silvarum]|uniref:uncharacterized protein LOC119459693 n=1 Tax=Dermacentor silvarum TaxID=543639 RepID=UPI0021011449|nr:uncharacterized protein LOC119459693 [Dermacentor silvarum]